MKAHETQFLSFLEGTKQFIIPIFQRPYSWSSKECNQFWNDILLAARGSIPAHFMGSVVYIQHGMHLLSSIHQVMVIDGQQRLTTISLLLSALGKILEEKNIQIDTNKTKLENRFLLNREESEENKYKLLLTKSDKDNLINILEGRESLIKGSSRLVQNYNLFLEKIRNTSDLNQLIQGINKLWIVEIGLDSNTDNPQLIYESLNSTGLALSKSDLVRNFVLMQLDKPKQDDLYNRYWYPMEQSFELDKHSTYFDRFIKDFLTIKLGRIPVMRELYSDFKSYVSLNRDRGIEDLVKEVSQYSEYYVQFAFEKIDDHDINDALHDINELKVDVSYPFLLEIFEDYYKGILTKDQLLLILRLVESYVFRRAICNIPTNSLNKTFANLSKEIDKENYLESLSASFFLMDGARRFPRNEEFTEDFLTRDIYHIRSIKHILSKLENFDNRKEQVDLKKCNVEHIMPQNRNLSPEWQKDLGKEWQKVQEKYLHTIGNLTLTGYNTELSDKPFLEKRNITGGFANSPLYLNRSLKQLDTWNEDLINKRSETLKDMAIQLWPFPQISSEVVEKYKKTEKKNNKTYSEEEHLEKGTDQAKKLYHLIKKEILNLGNDVTCTPTRYYVGFSRNSNFIALRIRKYYVKVTLVTKSNFTDSKNITVPDEIHHYKGRLKKVHLKNENQLPEIMDVIKQVYETN